MTLVRGGTVRPHVQAFANACSVATGATNFGTYNGHDPSIDRALDIFVPTTSRALGDAICAFAIANLKRFGVDYIIYRQRIYNPEIAGYWRDMADRGSPTQNHMDHVHISFEASAPATPEPEPEPAPDPQPQQEEPMIIVFDAPPERGGGVWQSDGIVRKPMRTGHTWPALGEDGAKVAKHIGVAEVGLFDDLIDIEAALAARIVVGEGDVDYGELARQVADELHGRLAG